MGVKEGCLILLTFSMVSNLNITKWLAKKIQFKNLLNCYKVMLIVICICSCALFMNINHYFIILLAIVIGIADGIYMNSILPELISSNPVF
jgi:hypothetical protein